jgi:hypothetical protein
MVHLKKKKPFIGFEFKIKKKQIKEYIYFINQTKSPNIA